MSIARGDSDGPKSSAAGRQREREVLGAPRRQEHNPEGWQAGPKAQQVGGGSGKCWGPPADSNKLEKVAAPDKWGAPGAGRTSGGSLGHSLPEA